MLPSRTHQGSMKAAPTRRAEIGIFSLFAKNGSLPLDKVRQVSYTTSIIIVFYNAVRNPPKTHRYRIF